MSEFKEIRDDDEGMNNALDYYTNVDNNEEWNNDYCLTFDYDDE